MKQTHPNPPLSGREPIIFSSPDKGRLGGVFSGRRSFIHYDSRLKEYARQNRKNPTAAEQKMWQILQRREFEGLKFTRQKPLDRFIVDFYCAEILLVVEIDGDSHSVQEEYDSRRSNILQQKYDIEVIRYANADVIHNMQGVYENLYDYLTKRRDSL